eukprot:NODE_757_length_4169_cov_0.564619.p2 type:complete len:233 gc:universal NODE_757_length_4169_cov_0.564619:3971-3273(-)
MNSNDQQIMNSIISNYKLENGIQYVASDSFICATNKFNQIFCMDTTIAYVRKWDLISNIEQVDTISINGRNICITKLNHQIWCNSNLPNGNWNQINGDLQQINLAGDQISGIGVDGLFYISKYPQIQWSRAIDTHVKSSSMDINGNYCILKSDGCIKCQFGDDLKILHSNKSIRFTQIQLAGTNIYALTDTGKIYKYDLNKNTWINMNIPNLFRQFYVRDVQGYAMIYGAEK